MKFLVDNQLPTALSQYLRKRGFDCQHVLEAGIIISKDEDFLYFAKQRDAKIRVIWVRLGNCRTPVLLAAFERSWPNIESCLNAGDRIIEIR